MKASIASSLISSLAAITEKCCRWGCCCQMRSSSSIAGSQVTGGGHRKGGRTARRQPSAARWMVAFRQRPSGETWRQRRRYAERQRQAAEQQRVAVERRPAGSRLRQVAALRRRLAAALRWRVAVERRLSSRWLPSVRRFVSAAWWSLAARRGFRCSPLAMAAADPSFAGDERYLAPAVSHWALVAAAWIRLLADRAPLASAGPSATAQSCVVVGRLLLSPKGWSWWHNFCSKSSHGPIRSSSGSDDISPRVFPS